MFYLFCDFAVVIVDPAISNAQNYKPYQDGLGMDVFIRVSVLYGVCGEWIITAGHRSKSGQNHTMTEQLTI